MHTGRAPRVLLIPGLNGDPGMLLRAAPVLFPGWQPLAFNHHRDTAQGGVEGLAERALARLNTESADAAPVYVCGESFGGTVALTMARAAPERIAGLILFSTFGWYPSALARRGAGALAVWSFLGGRVGTSMYHASRFVSIPSQLGLHFSSDVFHGYVHRPRSDIEAYRTKAELSLTFDARPWLATIEASTFVLTGRWDPVVPVSAGRHLARAMPNATLHTLGGGHLVHLVNASRVGKLIAQWAGT
ncbi:MAG: alpha/beta hydrolase [Chloroflexi bacterium]|nr:alpha/beta hydrolase [Chloroflexota bacterium]